MKARFKYRFYPSKTQQNSLARLFGCVRMVWNDALRICKDSEKKPSAAELQKLVITQAKKTEARSWLAEVSSTALQQSVADLQTAFDKYFKSLKGKKVGYPQFKKKENSQSARLTRGGFQLKDDRVKLAKIGWVRAIWSRELPAAPSSVTIIKDCANRYFLSFVVEDDPISVDAKNQSIGVDLGIKTFAVMSNGETAASPNYKALDRKIRKLQRKMARQQIGSKRRESTRLKIAKLHNRIGDTRTDFLHKLTTKLVSENGAIVLEDLNVSGMVKNRKLARAISQQGWREFRSLCETKSIKYDRDFRVINRWEPTSQTCSDCGFRWGKLDLSVRAIQCLNCGSQHDRDLNAAKNIEKVGMGHRHDYK